MTVERTYRCNLCRDEESGPDSMIGLWWSGNHLHLKRYFKTVEHHICRKCYDAIRAVEIEE